MSHNLPRLRSPRQRALPGRGLCPLEVSLLSQLPRKLRPVPHSNKPDRPPLDPIEEAVGSNYELTVGQIGKFRDYPPGLREFLKPSQGRLGPFSKTCPCGGIISTDIG